jgi:hypothetical protein
VVAGQCAVSRPATEETGKPCGFRTRPAIEKAPMGFSTALVRPDCFAAANPHWRLFHASDGKLVSSLKPGKRFQCNNQSQINQHKVDMVNASNLNQIPFIINGGLQGHVSRKISRAILTLLTLVLEVQSLPWNLNFILKIFTRACEFAAARMRGAGSR